jgi:hypothetical protein
VAAFPCLEGGVCARDRVGAFRCLPSRPVLQLRSSAQLICDRPHRALADANFFRDRTVRLLRVRSDRGFGSLAGRQVWRPAAADAWPSAPHDELLRRLAYLGKPGGAIANSAGRFRPPTLVRRAGVSGRGTLMDKLHPGESIATPHEAAGEARSEFVEG